MRHRWDQLILYVTREEWVPTKGIVLHQDQIVGVARMAVLSVMKRDGFMDGFSLWSYDDGSVNPRDVDWTGFLS